MNITISRLEYAGLLFMLGSAWLRWSTESPFPVDGAPTISQWIFVAKFVIFSAIWIYSWGVALVELGRWTACWWQERKHGKGAG